MGTREAYSLFFQMVEGINVRIWGYKEGGYGQFFINLC